MKKEAKLLLEKAMNSLILSIEHFNRPWDNGRAESVLISLDHSFEMLLKAGIVHRGGKIRERRARQTIGFDTSIRRALSDANIKFLGEEQALTLQMINSLRDAAQHYLLEISEQQLYLHTQAGVTLFRDILKNVFDLELAERLPERVLPVSTKPPTDLASMIADEVAEIRRLIAPRVRRRTEARARVRSIAIIEGAVQGEHVQPSTADLNRVLKKISQGEKWDNVFPGVSALKLQVDGSGLTFNLRITKEDGIPIQLVKEGTPGAAVVAVKRVNELGFYSLGLNQVAQKVGLTAPRTLAVIRYLSLQNDPDYFKEFRIGSTRFKRYSMKAVERLKTEIKSLDMDKVWTEYRPGKKLNKP